MIKGAIFDIDGTLLDSMPVWDEAGERYLKSRGIVPERALGKKMFSMTMEEGARYLKETYQIPEGTTVIADGINRQIEKFYLYEAELKRGRRTSLHILRESRYGLRRLHPATGILWRPLSSALELRNILTRYLHVPRPVRERMSRKYIWRRPSAWGQSRKRLSCLKMHCMR